MWSARPRFVTRPPGHGVRLRAFPRSGGLGLIALGLVILHVGAAPAANGVFSLDRVRLGAGGPENYVFTAADVVAPDGGADTGSYYRFVVTDAAGTVRNGSFPCTAAS